MRQSQEISTNVNKGEGIRVHYTSVADGVADSINGQVMVVSSDNLTLRMQLSHRSIQPRQIVNLSLHPERSKRKPLRRGIIRLSFFASSRFQGNCRINFHVLAPGRRKDTTTI